MKQTRQPVRAIRQSIYLDVYGNDTQHNNKNVIVGKKALHAPRLCWVLQIRRYAVCCHAVWNYGECCGNNESTSPFIKLQPYPQIEV